MKKILKIIGWTVLILIIGGIAVGTYFYQTDPMIKAIVNNDESKLYYFPTKEVSDMDGLDYVESFLTVEDSIKIYTYQFKPSGENRANIFFIHGAGGNVSTYSNLIRPLTDNGFVVYSLDWRGYGKSTGTPHFRGVMKDTEMLLMNFWLRQPKIV